MRRGRWDGGEGWVLGCVRLRRRLCDEARRGRLGRWGGEDEVGGGGGGRGGAERGVCVRDVVVRVCVSVGVGLRVRDGQRELAASTRPARRWVRVVESVWGSRGDGGVRGQRWGRDETRGHVVARVLDAAMLHPLMLLGMRGSAAGRALPPRCREPVREGVVLRDALHVVAVMVVVGWGRRLLLLVPSNTDSSSSTVAVAILGVQSLELGRSPSRTSSPSNSSRVRLAEVGRWGGAWGRGGWVGDGRRGGGVVGG